LKTGLKTSGFIHTAVFAALLCAAAPFSIPLGPVPISLATLIIYISAGVLGRGRATLAAVLYVLLGAAGLPVFTGFEGGLQKLLGVTGGYIIGYIPLAFISGSFSSFGFSRRGAPVPAGLYLFGMITGTAALYALGTAWFVFSTSSPLLYSLAVCVAPFLPGDALKLAAALVAAPAIRRGVGRYLS
jgi:biotin transport system substrate-specific component